MSILDTRYGGMLVHHETRDTGGMFDARLGVEQLPAPTESGNKFRAFVVDWHGGVQRFRPTFEEAMGELERLQLRLPVSNTTVEVSDGSGYDQSTNYR